MMRRIAPGLALVMLFSGLAACSGKETPPTPSTTAITSASAVTTAPSTSDSPSTSTAGSVTAAMTGPPIIQGVTETPKKLVLADVFEHEYWGEGLVSVPGRSGAVQGIYARLSCGSTASLELRFASQSGVIKVDVAQALDSRTSGSVLEFKLFADGRLVNTVLVKFNAQGHLETPITGVGAVRLEARPVVQSPCSATAVVTELSVTPASPVS